MIDRLVDVLFEPTNPLGVGFQAAIGSTLSQILARRRAEVLACDNALATVVDLLTPLVMHGKHIRPAFAWWAFVALAGEPADPSALLQMAASLELMHAGLLAHDDLIDCSDMRRGVPSTHRAMAALADDEALGVAGAVIGGAWLMAWAQQAFDECGLASTPVRAAFNLLRNRVLAGQMADAWAAAGLSLTGTGSTALDMASTVAEIDDLKTASYTVVGPLGLGSLAAGATAEELVAFGVPLGRAFQARDDVLGMFGQPETTGKPSGDDLLQGKLTSLVQKALVMASPSNAEQLRGLIGQRNAAPQQIDWARKMIISCGALESVEQAIANDLSEALDALARADLTTAGRVGLAHLATACVNRDR